MDGDTDKRREGYKVMKNKLIDIPKQFELMGHTIKVEFDSCLLHRENLVGEARYRDNKIILQPDTKDHPISKEDLLHNFLHELMHFVLLYLGEKELNNNEMFVDASSNLLLQFLKTRV